MLMTEMPYFMKNKEWYTISYDEYGDAIYTPTEKAPPKAVQSMKDFMIEFKKAQEEWFWQCFQVQHLYKKMTTKRIKILKKFLSRERIELTKKKEQPVFKLFFFLFLFYCSN